MTTFKGDKKWPAMQPSMCKSPGSIPILVQSLCIKNKRDIILLGGVFVWDTGTRGLPQLMILLQDISKSKPIPSQVGHSYNHSYLEYWGRRISTSCKPPWPTVWDFVSKKVIKIPNYGKNIIWQSSNDKLPALKKSKDISAPVLSTGCHPLSPQPA